MIALITSGYEMEKKKKKERKAWIVYVFDSMHNEPVLIKETNSAFLSSAEQCAPSWVFSSCTAAIDFINEDSFCFDDALNWCLCEGKLSVTATNVPV